jgi:hypothetical protein
MRITRRRRHVAMLTIATAIIFVALLIFYQLPLA